ncbi:formate dehydrogenase subunit gamma [Thauera linaloolentis]|uniref:Formate dehydrogenase subunit gamma n=1 Tax=Thauera linaloolentis (strain DSM 12138 / JCM 21573 / CCUG 41526 / CIP 105981 / IAM 15112 / NBRC 102519 / 47Lol) TaxID=1123367 RepID=N6YWF8_THAL4|nr:formate dehydrogenase subunit gamma [Thauera linaloolentis]ENO86453.1 formate dehydrogenase subunit gamma [Thauera linaloolentis 47Lol = DSM 12138]MCM8567334.1 formate dehydrogenase subunit gamma [Thauera linaloolentis]
MIRNPRDLQRYTASERANHWIVGICFILLALSGLAFFHPALFPLVNLFGGGTWARILHPWIGVVMALFFIIMFFRFACLNLMRGADWDWLSKVGKMVDGNDHDMPEQGKYNGGQKLLFWLLTLCMALIIGSGVVMWRSQFDFPVGLVRTAVVVHAAAAAFMIGLIFVHVYAAIWTRGTIRAMLYGTVTRAWAKQHHRGWYRQMTGKN